MIKIASSILKSFLAFFFSSEKLFKQINGKHNGEECYIFGDGISLKYMDLSFFSDKPAIACNNFIFHKDFKKVDVKYYTLFEPFWFFPFYRALIRKRKIVLNKIQFKERILIKQNPNIIFFSDISNSAFFRNRNLIFISNRIKNFISPKKILENDINCFAGSLNIQIVIAIFLGFKKAYLVGCDYTHSNSLSGHFYEKGKGISNNHYKWNQKFLSLASNYLELVTVTIDSESDTLGFIKYDSISKSNFKDNHEIVSKENLRILSSWPGYNI